MDEALSAAIWARIAIGTDEECWNWLGYLSGGYGEIKINGINVKAHRFAYEQTYGTIPKRRCVGHSCYNRKCCNPSHMYLKARGPAKHRSPTTFWANVDIQAQDDCWNWKRAVHYGAYVLLGELYAHRIAYRLAVGEIPAGMVVCHHCDNPRCCNPAHLFIGTQADNVRDMNQKGRRASKINEQDREDIRKALENAPRGTTARLAQQYGLSRNYVGQLKHRK